MQSKIYMSAFTQFDFRGACFFFPLNTLKMWVLKMYLLGTLMKLTPET